MKQKKQKYIAGSGMLVMFGLSMFACSSGTVDKQVSEPSVATVQEALCPVPAVSGTVGALPAAAPNQIPPGFITAIVANGTSTLQVSYRTTAGTTQTLPIVSGDSQITFTGGWQKTGVIFSVVASGNTINFNNGQGIITVANATVSGSAVWSGLNSGVGKITGSGAGLQFAGYNANSSNLAVNIFFTVCKNPATPTTTCTTDANCTSGTAPACGDVTTGICSAGTCYYTMHGTYFPPSGCYCVEGDVQDCKTSGSMTYDGVQTCSIVTSSPLVTGWGACTSSSPFVGHTPQFFGNSSMRSCTGSASCEDLPDYPVCATFDYQPCVGASAPKECIWMRAAEHGCNCIQYDIRTCNKSGGGTGHQMCDVTGSDPLNVDWGEATGWGTCL